MMFFFKHIFERDIRPFLEPALEQLCQLEQEGDTDFVMLLLNYLLTTGETEQAKQVVALVQQRLSPAIGAKVMTIAEQFIEQGVQRGEAILLMRQLQRKFGALPLKYSQQIENADASRLLEWGDQLLEANSLESLFTS